MKLKASGPGWWSFILVVVVLALPIFDTGLVTAYRLWKGRALAQGGKDHTSHRLMKLGLPYRWAVLVLYGAAVCAGMVALALARGGIDVGLLLALPALAVVLGAGFVLARVEL